jgi:hypothetical protein
MGRGRVVLAGAIAVAAMAGPASAHAASEGLTIVDPAKVYVHPDADGVVKGVVVTVRNDGAAIATNLTFTFVGDKGAMVTQSKPSGIVADGVARYELTIHPERPSKTTTGQLLVSSPGRPTGSVPTTISPTEKVPSWVLLVILLPIGGALVFVLLAWATAGSSGKLGDNLGPVEWDFSKSWASNVTVFAALLGTILSAGVLPKETSAARTATYAALNLVFGLGILVGPFLYTAFQSGVEVHKRGKSPELQYQGKLWAFLVASIITLGATAGEFATIWKLFGQLHKAGSLPDAGLVAFEVLVAIGGLSLVVLSWRRLRAILHSQSEPEKKRRKKARHEHLQLLGVSALSEDDVKPELEAWPAF